MGKLIIRESAVADFPALVGILSTTEAWTSYGINYDMAIGLFNEMEDAIYIAEIDNKVIGFITLRINGVGNIGAYIRMIAAAEGCRGQGVGSAMLNYVNEIASKKMPNLFLICSLENLGAQRFYVKMGFQKIGILKNLVVKDRDEILFRKKLGTIH